MARLSLRVQGRGPRAELAEHDTAPLGCPWRFTEPRAELLSGATGRGYSPHGRSSSSTISTRAWRGSFNTRRSVRTSPSFFASISTALTFPLLTALAAAAVLVVFVPSSGGQWVIQGFITARKRPPPSASRHSAACSRSVSATTWAPALAVLGRDRGRRRPHRFPPDHRIQPAVRDSLWFVLGVLAFFTFLH